MQVWKFELGLVSGPQNVLVPGGANLLKVGRQTSDTVCFWALVNPDSPFETWTFEVFGTGHNIPNRNDLYYMGTVEDVRSPFVWHVFRHTHK